MKKLFIAGIMLCTLLPNAINAQDIYYPMLNQGASWRVGQMGCGMFIHDLSVGSQDTLIAGQTYKKIIGSNEWSGSSDAFYAREDIANKRVYGYSAAIQQEILLYDFGLQAGNSFDLTVANNWDSTATIFPHSIDSVGVVQMLDGTWRKRIFLSKLYTDESPWVYAYSWIEGMGCDSIAPFNYNPQPWLDMLLCHTEKAQTAWVNMFWGNDYCDAPAEPEITAISPIAPSAIVLNAMPNPTHSHWIVSCADTEKLGQNSRLLLYNAQGQLVQNIAFNTNPLQIDSQHLKTGIYILQWIDHKGNALGTWKLSKN
jgi:hypothetical protein